MAVVVVDASTIIAYLSPTDALHLRAVKALSVYLAEQLILPVSAYAEILVGPYRAGETAALTVEQFVAALGMRVEPLSRNMARRAARLRAQHRSLRLPDAFVLATADELGAAKILTGDAAWAKLSPQVQVI